MYSVVLMMAAATSGDAIDCHRHRGGDCTGGGYSCSGGGCYGGGYGACYGGAGWGGCSGGWGRGCTGGSSYGVGSPYGVRYGGSSQSMYYNPGYGGAIIQPEPIKKPRNEGTEDRKEERKEERRDDNPPSKAPQADQAPDARITAISSSILVSLPADAKLTIDDLPTASASEERRFITPPLPVGKEFRYVLQAEVNRDGKTMKSSRSIVVRPGEETRASLTLKDFSESAE